jgi:hypothetical protein
MRTLICAKCGKVIDLENDEYLTTAEGTLCVDCANNNCFVGSSSSEPEQSFMTSDQVIDDCCL